LSDKAIKVVLVRVDGQGSMEWKIYSTDEDEAKKECNTLIERFKPGFTPDDEFRDFKPVKNEKYAYTCRYEYRYMSRHRRAID